MVGGIWVIEWEWEWVNPIPTIWLGGMGMPQSPKIQCKLSLVFKFHSNSNSDSGHEPTCQGIWSIQFPFQSIWTMIPVATQSQTTCTLKGQQDTSPSTKEKGWIY